MSDILFKQNVWILTSDNLHFLSVNSISTNLVRLYSSLFSKHEVININQIKNLQKITTLEMPKIIISTSPQVIHSELFKLILLMNPKAIYLIHVLGDFIKRYELLIKKNEIFINKKIHFITPSKKYFNMVSNCTSSKSQIHMLPIPIESRNRTKRNSTLRRIEKIKKNRNNIIVCYTGRIHPQKNIIETIELLNKLRNTLPNLNIYFIMIGDVEIVDRSTLNIPLLSNIEFYNSFIRKLDNFNIHIPHQNHSVLNLIYKQSDIFLSLSTYHDEAYGLSPREAAIEGCSLLLSRWGGHDDLSILGSKYCQLINLNTENLSINFMEFSSAFRVLLTNKNKKEVQKKSRTYFSNLSIKKYYKRKIAMIDQETKFSGFISDRPYDMFDLKTYQQTYHEMWAINESN